MSFLQSLGKSFLLIIPKNSEDEQKLLENLKFLKETYGGRLMDFEEETILRKFYEGEEFFIFNKRRFWKWGFGNDRVGSERNELILWERKQRGFGTVDGISKEE